MSSKLPQAPFNDEDEAPHSWGGSASPRPPEDVAHFASLDEAPTAKRSIPTELLDGDPDSERVGQVTTKLCAADIEALLTSERADGTTPIEHSDPSDDSSDERQTLPAPSPPSCNGGEP